MEAMLNFIPAPIAIALMLLGFVALAVGGIRLGYKATVKDLALELVKKAELSIMGSGQGAKKKKQVFAALRTKCPALSAGPSPTRCWMLSSNTPLTVMTGKHLGKKS
mgnify:CR=1 FL=1